jgi:ERCC4-type nuclease
MTNNILPTIIRDSREKKHHGYNFIASKNCAGMEIAKLDFGDYAIKDYPDLIVIERKKSVSELCANLGVKRERFEAELQRMIDAGCKRKYIVIEDYYSSIYRQKFSRMHPNAILESLNAISIKYDVHVIFAGTHEMAHKIVRSLLLKAYDYRLEGVL